MSRKDKQLITHQQRELADRDAQIDQLERELATARREATAAIQVMNDHSDELAAAATNHVFHVMLPRVSRYYEARGDLQIAISRFDDTAQLAAACKPEVVKERLKLHRQALNLAVAKYQNAADDLGDDAREDVENARLVVGMIQDAINAYMKGEGDANHLAGIYADLKPNIEFQEMIEKLLQRTRERDAETIDLYNEVRKQQQGGTSIRAACRVIAAERGVTAEAVRQAYKRVNDDLKVENAKRHKRVNGGLQVENGKSGYT